MSRAQGGMHMDLGTVGITTYYNTLGTVGITTYYNTMLSKVGSSAKAKHMCINMAATSRTQRC